MFWRNFFLTLVWVFTNTHFHFHFSDIRHRYQLKSLWTLKERKIWTTIKTRLFWPPEGANCFQSKRHLHRHVVITEPKKCSLKEVQNMNSLRWDESTKNDDVEEWRSDHTTSMRSSVIMAYLRSSSIKFTRTLLFQDKLLTLASDKNKQNARCTELYSQKS